MVSEISREDNETIAIVLRGNIGISTNKAEILSVHDKEEPDGPVVFASESVTVTLGNAVLTELRALLAAFEKEASEAP